MPRLPRLRGRGIFLALRRGGFEILRIKGSHHFLQHPDGRRTVVPVHAGEIIGPGLFNKILKDAEIELQEFEEWL
jgi:predicted RNA binding protein YcfA (HicA-like mRNA interferase family)